MVSVRYRPELPYCTRRSVFRNALASTRRSGHYALVAEALIDVVARLQTVPRGDRYDPGPAIFVKRPVTQQSDAIVLAEEVIDGTAPSSPEYSYLLDVAIAKEVLEVWSSWRSGAAPSLAEAADAVIYYAANDSYQPTE